MRKHAMAGLALLSGMAIGMSGALAQAGGTTATSPATTGAATGAATQIQLSQEQRNKLKQALSTGERQSKPGGFAATVGQTVPEAVEMQSLPQQAHQDIPTLTENHKFARMDDGTVVIADQDRRIVATLREDATTGAGTGAAR